MTAPPRLRAVGESALSAVYGETIDATTNARVRALDARLAAFPFPGFEEAIPSHCALLVLYDAALCDYATAAAAVGEAAALAEPGEVRKAGALRELPVVYGGEHGVDLLAVAEACELSVAEVVSRHTAAELTAFMLGFSPGFAYLGLLPRELQRPRRSVPRERVPPGSVGVAGPFTAVYPSASAGGWHLIGRTSQVLFDPGLEPPSLILPGDRVRFRAVDTLFPAAPPTSAHNAAGEPVLEVLEPGLLTTVQDAGRRQRRRLGVAPAGAIDREALAAANRVLGNPQGAAALECTLAGPTLRFLAGRELAIAGADLGAVLERSDLGAWPIPLGTPVRARAGNVLRFAGRKAGARAYVAIAGGLLTVEVLGSRSASLVGGFPGLAGRALCTGDVLMGGAPGPRPLGGPPPRSAPAERAVLRVVPGPQDEAFDVETRAEFLSTEYTLTTSSDRAGWRLLGPALKHAGPGEIASEGMVPGCIQVPPDGQPIVMGPDGPTTGGYPKIATVISVDLPRLAQLVPGEGRVRFTAVSVEEAQALFRAAARP